MARSLVKNAADPKQVEFGGRKEKRRGLERFALVQTQLSTPHGRAFVWAELERHGIDDLVSGPPDLVAMFLGKREAGIQLKAEIMEHHPDAFLVMQAEAMQRAKRDSAEVDAVQMTTATTQED
jgi:hypothetical protein